MAKLDIAQTAFSGFGLIRREPIAPLVWGLVQTLLAMLPLVFIGPVLLEMFSSLAASGGTGEPDMSQLLAYQAQLNLFAPVSWVLGLLSYGVITGATFRAILSPEDKAWFFMRVGMAEVMLVVVSIVWVILLVVAMVPLGLIVAIFAFIGSMVSEGVAILLGVLLGFVAVGVLIWGAMRTSLAFAMSFERKGFLLFESWKPTKGNSFRLFLMWLLNFIVVVILSSLVMGVVFGILAGVALGGGGMEALMAEDFAAFFTPERLSLLIPLGIVAMLLSAALQGYLNVLLIAPWAEAYRQLVPKTAEVF
ncbi:hypothetical protein GVN21_06590 [Caulobacter sp. SLTY]|uniref:hypothetical protein n=1 Tax=Caulobacter sp. SLTY TaxID=2683262 RepID=UPI00141316CA|nr:hypothetical protein [Caulobacter sp. SLTY]NBB15020.1 hypothetical protein [Caulobacter sp. SLTY]